MKILCLEASFWCHKLMQSSKPTPGMGLINDFCLDKAKRRRSKRSRSNYCNLISSFTHNVVRSWGEAMESCQKVDKYFSGLFQVSSGEMEVLCHSLASLGYEAFSLAAELTKLHPRSRTTRIEHPKRPITIAPLVKTWLRAVGQSRVSFFLGDWNTNPLCRRCTISLCRRHSGVNVHCVFCSRRSFVLRYDEEKNRNRHQHNRLFWRDCENVTRVKTQSTIAAGNANWAFPKALPFAAIDQ